MKTFFDLYEKVLNDEVNGRRVEVRTLEQIGYDRKQIDCLTHPEKYPPVLVTKTGGCNCKEPKCVAACLFEAIGHDSKGNVRIDAESCVGCEKCIEACDAEKLAASRDTVALLESMSKYDRPVYALVAPAAEGQFGDEVTMGKLRTAFKKLGFTGMVEVALFADVLTLKEALEFDKSIQNDGDFLLTSCCCPMWISMIRKVYTRLVPHVPPSVSPMIACGRTVKKIHSDCTTVFVGPCLAKKAEAKEKDLRGAVDFVLTFSEVKEIFDAAGIEPGKLQDDGREHSSCAGRIYARTGGVSEAVRRTVERISPEKKIKLKARQANGVKECKELLNDISNGIITANFLEGMGCAGGCVGGPRSLTGRERGTKLVNSYGATAEYDTPAENPYVADMLRRIGIDTIAGLTEDSDIFSRKF